MLLLINQLSQLLLWTGCLSTLRLEKSQLNYTELQKRPMESLSTQAPTRATHPSTHTNNGRPLWETLLGPVIGDSRAKAPRRLLFWKFQVERGVPVAICTYIAHSPAWQSTEDILLRQEAFGLNDFLHRAGRNCMFTAPETTNYATLLNTEGTQDNHIRYMIASYPNPMLRKWWQKKIEQPGPWTDGGNTIGCRCGKDTRLIARLCSMDTVVSGILCWWCLGVDGAARISYYVHIQVFSYI